MVEKKLQVCDICEEKVAKHSCGVCKTDLCTTCAKRYPLVSLPIETVLMRICKPCLKKTMSLFQDQRFVDQFIDNFSKLVQSSNILDELEEDE